MSITEKRLNEIQERLNAATKGPWFVEYESEECPPFKPYAHAIHGPTMQGVLEGPVSDDFKARYGHQMDEVAGVADADAEFIAHAREDIPALLAEVHRLRGELAKAREVTDDMIERAALVDLNMGLKFRGLGPVKSLEEIKPILGEEGPYRLRSTMRAALIAVLGGGKNV